MNQLFRPYLRRFVTVFFDDILIYSGNSEEHVSHLRVVLQLLRSHRFYAKVGKCQFFQDTIEYLCHIVSSQEVTADPAKIAAIVEWPVPQTVKQ